jgi:hypothetical protein
MEVRMDSHDVEVAIEEMRKALTPHVGANWSATAGRLDWTCWQTAAHIGHDLLAYAGQLVAPPADGYLPFDLVVRPTATPAEVLNVATACGRLLSSALSASRPETRAWHWGPCDPGGFAAMGVGETLLHTYDIMQTLQPGWLPPADLCSGVLNRLLPEAPPGEATEVLLWCTGRGKLGDLPHQDSWVWHAALSK